MPDFPHPHIRRLGPVDAAAVQAWWDGLTEAVRGDLLARWDKRGNRCRFAASVACPDDRDRLPIRVGVRFLPADPPDPGDDWRTDYLEHLLNDPAVTLYDIPWVQVMGICTAHPMARAVLVAGVIPADFACPLADAGCPLRRLLAEAPGRDARLTLLPVREVADAR